MDNKNSRIPSIVKKYLMALSGLALALFVLGHMAGNLQMFISQDMMNDYAHKLQNLPYGLLWVARSGLLLAVGVHVWMAILLTIENKKARPIEYEVKKTVQASLASKTMGLSGSVILLFIVFHILHFTTKTIYPEYFSLTTSLHGQTVPDAYTMVILGFSKTWVSLFYIVAMGLLCLHLSHGVSSLFASLGLRNSKWRPTLNTVSNAYAWIVFLGFSSIPLATLISKYTNIKIFPL